MPIFLVIPLASNTGPLNDAVRGMLPEHDRHYLVNDRGWLVTYNGTTKELTHRMDADQKVSAARMESKLDALKESTDSTKKKVDDLVRWKTLILGGAVVLGVVVSSVFALYVKFSDRIAIAPADGHQSAPGQTILPPPPAPPKP